ncbi:MULTISPECIES: class I SAM-dependent methyltransferase [Brevibacillus]|uniref:class I SAM-dependent methyltransferase n=1 Tax=Brevibacillus TaxID=55080 RepID=UPI000D0EC618|nr:MULTISPECIES: class I SAM-dependent methyltransferase [Brevibacillus]MED1948955.1 class I SAM-dependent methyltransferase [Brevibacillus formosus]MED2001478.1 class I SAM-dependent methyltransferase [Brevibacillus formosus]MED2085563.1 class I SAM-dependent methyltransferase [Brevibacillus formosus]PSK11500.1 class I SAM-dependent methyltransferase [Brevibacillus sp. NRRL NRS-603]
MPNHEHIYKNQAEQYDLMISRQPSLLAVIEEITPIKGKDVIDLGAGSGRLTSVLAPHAKSILALDASAAMLEVNAQQLRQAGLSNWKTSVADHRNIPVDDNSADVILAGWTVCYLTSSEVPNNELNLEKIILEMKRALRPGGMIVIIETMGTGYETPHPPEFLTQYYSLLENRYGFSHKWIRLDYRFADLKEAERQARFFFGDELVDRVVVEKLVTLPECAGVWWLEV